MVKGLFSENAVSVFKEINFSIILLLTIICYVYIFYITLYGRLGLNDLKPLHQ